MSLLQRVGHYFMLLHMLAIISHDLKTRLAAFKEHKQASILRNAIFKNLTAIMPDMYYRELWRNLIAIVEGCQSLGIIQLAGETDDSASDGEDDATCPSQSCWSEKTAHGGNQATSAGRNGSKKWYVDFSDDDELSLPSKDVMVEYLASPGQLCQAVHSFIALAVMFHEDLENCQDHISDTKSEPLIGVLVNQWRDLTSLDARKSFVETMEAPEFKMRFIAEVFKSYSAKPSCPVPADEKLSTLQQILSLVSSRAQILALRRVNLPPDSLAVIILHLIEAHLSAILQDKGGIPTIQEGDKGQSLSTMTLQVIECVRTVCGKRILPQTSKSLDAAKLLASLL